MFEGFESPFRGIDSAVKGRAGLQILDGFLADEFPVRFGSGKAYDCYTFRRGDNELLLALWLPGKTEDGIVEEESDIRLLGVRADRACVVDTMNGTEQELNLTHCGADTVLGKMLIKDYPVFIRTAQ